MKTKFTLHLACFCILHSAFCLSALAQDTAFTYQGRLNDGGNPAAGSYDLRFAIYDSTNSPGVIIAGPLTNAATGVSNGLFAVTLDFGAGVFDGNPRWLQIDVHTNTLGPFTPLSPRQPLTASPYAVFSSGSGSVSNGFIRNPVFLGTTGSLPLELFAGGGRALRLEPNTNGAPNVIGGSPVNQVDADVIGATISGGGIQDYFGAAYSNRVAMNFSAIGGGIGNLVQGIGSVIGGGYLNSIQTNASVSVIAGGYGNVLQSNAGYSGIGGGYFNTIEIGAFASFIAGGSGNVIQSGVSQSSIGGGVLNTNGASDSVIAGGNNNLIEPFADNSVIGGGWLNYIQGGADQSVIAGGNAGKILAGARESFVGGGFANTIQSNAQNSFIGGGAYNTNGPGGTLATIGGGLGGFNGGYAATIAGGLNNTATTNGAAVGGGGFNFASGVNSVVAGGSYNTNRGNTATIAGGSYNLAAIAFSTVGGGFQNFASGNFNGFGDSATVAGGYQNSALGNNAFVGGGFQNFARGDNSAIGGGWLHTNQTGFGFIGGGQQNLIEIFARFSVVSGGDNNSVRSNSTYSVISGGQLNLVGTNASYAILPGGFSNQVTAPNGLAAGRRAKAGHPGAFVWADATDAEFASTASNQFNVRATGGVRLETAGAGGTLDGQPLLSSIGNGGGLTNVNAAALGGQGASNFWQLGGNNVAGGQFLGSTNNQPLELRTGGFRSLRLEPTVTDASHSNIVNVIGGSPANFVGAGIYGATIAGGGAGKYFVAGYSNAVAADFGTVGGGYGNTINSVAGAVNGGAVNTILNNAAYASIGGGVGNTNNGYSGALGGGFYNGLLGQFATVPGGDNNLASGANSFAAGHRAKATHPGSFVWADSQGADFTSTTNNQFNIRASGGVRLSDDTPALSFGGAIRQMLNLWNTQYGIGVQSYRLYFRTDAGAGFAWFAGGSHSDLTDNPGSGGTELMRLDESGNLNVRGIVATNVLLTSDRAAKENFRPADPRMVLDKVAALPVSVWQFKGDPNTRHIGPMAQDFYAAFNVGADDRHIAVVDEGGVALAAIQGLNQKLEEQSAENAALKQRLARLEQLLDRMTGGGELRPPTPNPGRQ